MRKSQNFRAFKLAQGHRWLLLVRLLVGIGSKILSKKKRENMQFDKEKSTNLFKVGDKTSTDKAANLVTNETGILEEGTDGSRS